MREGVIGVMSCMSFFAGTHHEGPHHIVVLVHAIVAVYHVLAQVGPEARGDDHLVDICADVNHLQVSNTAPFQQIHVPAGISTCTTDCCNAQQWNS